MSGFQDLARAVMRRTRLNTDYFAERVTYRTADGEEMTLDAHVRHHVRFWSPPDSNEQETVEQIEVELDREELSAEPGLGCRILLDGETVAYMYAHKGRHTLTSYKGVYERRAMLAQGVPKGLDKRKMSPRQ